MSYVQVAAQVHSAGSPVGWQQKEKAFGQGHPLIPRYLRSSELDTPTPSFLRVCVPHTRTPSEFKATLGIDQCFRGAIARHQSGGRFWLSTRPAPAPCLSLPPDASEGSREVPACAHAGLLCCLCRSLYPDVSSASCAVEEWMRIVCTPIYDAALICPARPSPRHRLLALLLPSQRTMTSLFARSSLLSARPASFRPLPPTLAGRRLIATGSPKSDSPADAGVDQSHTGRVRIGVSLAAAVTLVCPSYSPLISRAEGTAGGLCLRWKKAQA